MTRPTMKRPRIVVLQDGTIYVEGQGDGQPPTSLHWLEHGKEVTASLRARITGLGVEDVPVYVETR